MLDEPTSYLDLKNQFTVLKIISRIARDRDVTVVMALHDPNHALMFSDVGGLAEKLSDDQWRQKDSLNSGSNLVAARRPDEVMTPDNIREAYGIDVELLVVGGRKMLFPL